MDVGVEVDGDVEAIFPETSADVEGDLERAITAVEVTVTPGTELSGISGGK